MRPVVLTGWSPASCWGYDARLEGYWAALWRTGGPPGPADVVVSAEHLVPTVAALVRAVAWRTGLDEWQVYLAVTGGPSGGRSTRPDAVPDVA